MDPRRGAALPWAGVRPGREVCPDRAPRAGSDRGSEGRLPRAASWPLWRPARRREHPDAVGLWVTRLRVWGAAAVRRQGRAAPQVSSPRGRAGAWWEGRGLRRAVRRVPESRMQPPIGSLLELCGEPFSTRSRRAAGILAGTRAGGPQVAQSGLPAGSWVPQEWGLAQALSWARGRLFSWGAPAGT